MFFHKAKLCKLAIAVGAMALCQSSMAATFVKYIDNVKNDENYNFQFQYNKPQGKKTAVYVTVSSSSAGQLYRMPLYESSTWEASNQTVTASATIPSSVFQKVTAPAKLTFYLNQYYTDVNGSSWTSVVNDNKFLQTLQDPKVVLKMGDWATRKSYWTSYKTVANAQRFNNISGKTVGAYYANWSVWDRKYFPKMIPVEGLTHIYHAFIGVCGSFDKSIAEAAKGTDEQAVTKFDENSLTSYQNICYNKAKGQLVFTDAFADTLMTGLDSTESKSNPSTDPVMGIFAEYYRMKMAFPNIKIIASIGGWYDSEPFYGIAADPTARNYFASQVASFLAKYDFFDGVDIDWEYPGVDGFAPGASSTTADSGNLIALLSTTRDWLNTLGARTGKTYEMTMAVAGSSQKLAPVDWQTAGNYLNRFNVMTYDYYGPWNNQYGSHTALYDGCLSTPVAGVSANAAVRTLKGKGVQSNKIGIGVAAYGKGWQGISGNASGPFGGSGGAPMATNTAAKIYEAGTPEFNGAFAGVWNGMGTPNWGTYMFYQYYSKDGGTVYGANGYNVIRDSCAQAEYLWNQTAGNFVTLDTPYSVRMKANYAISNSLGGIFLFDTAKDTGHLLYNMNKGLGNSGY